MPAGLRPSNSAVMDRRKPQILPQLIVDVWHVSSTSQESSVIRGSLRLRRRFEKLDDSPDRDRARRVHVLDALAWRSIALPNQLDDASGQSARGHAVPHSVNVWLPSDEPIEKTASLRASPDE